MRTVVEAWSGRLACGHNIVCNPGWRTLLPDVGEQALCRRCGRWGTLLLVRPLRLTRLRRLVCPARLVAVRRAT